MGMFDSLLFNCPNCGEMIEEQTKSGPCMMDSYRLNERNCPQWILLDFSSDDGIRGECYRCGKPYLLKIKTEVKILERTVEPADNLDFVAWTKKHKKPWVKVKKDESSS